MLEHALLFADWLYDHKRRDVAIVFSAAWPYRFAAVLDTQLATAETLNERAPELIPLLAEICERQRDRLRGFDYSMAYEPWEPMTFDPHMNLAALRFDPRATDAEQINRDGPSIVFALTRELELARECRNA
ncbi:hypothetical protein QCE73_00215 [Caballeronia sp. LZ029]|uniref:hypothetical protein n=1 Tax=Caballeronia sp. LZ029 TaxID=3038564 RepID=UPI0028580A43|nr:hypothetical protein [Caballeronia sp. LZ029]MDR5741571.1 hypothetical protein [Caballeronia sp. LZ029]